MRRFRFILALAKIIILAYNLVDEKIRDVVVDLKSLGEFDGDYDRLRLSLVNSVLGV